MPNQTPTTVQAAGQTSGSTTDPQPQKRNTLRAPAPPAYARGSSWENSISAACLINAAHAVLAAASQPA